MALVVFSHANSFPAGTYGVLFAELRRRGFTIEAVDRIGHHPDYPVSDNWPHLAKQLADFAHGQAARHGQAPFLVGHSLGGYLSLMAACRRPLLAGHEVAGVLLLDSPVVSGWRATALGVAKRTPLVGAMAPAAVSRRRRHQWKSAEAALEHFRGKKAFARWDDAVLRDYIAHGTVDTPEGHRTLAFEREIETAIYRTVPDNLPALLRRHPPRCPVAFIGGRSSAEIRQVGLGSTERITKGRMMMLDGGHLFPMERPQVAAAAIEAALRNMQAP